MEERVFILLASTRPRYLTIEYLNMRIEPAHLRPSVVYLTDPADMRTQPAHLPSESVFISVHLRLIPLLLEPLIHNHPEPAHLLPQ